MTPADVDPLVVRRVLRVPRERVFAAWLDAALMARWMCPGDTRSATVELDPRVGGKFRIVMHHRSEEHTSELQSRVDLVCRLLLEKKKKQQKQHSNKMMKRRRQEQVRRG